MSKSKTKKNETSEKLEVNDEEVKDEIVAEEESLAEEVESTEASEESEPEIQDTELVKAQTQIEKQQKELADAQDKYMRLYAEFDNYRKRTANELQNAKVKGVDSALNAFFPCLDSIDRAIAMCKDETQAAGFKLIGKQFENALFTLGVKAIDPLGEEFNPEYHNAVLKELDPDNAGKIIQVLLKGYIYKDTLLRPAMVKIASDE